MALMEAEQLFSAGVWAELRGRALGGRHQAGGEERQRGDEPHLPAAEREAVQREQSHQDLVTCTRSACKEATGDRFGLRRATSRVWR